jgi:undecaprenyl-diphosphatase
MSLVEALLLGLLQGVTEFLPISSSGHLILAESYMELPMEDLIPFDIAVHFGTLIAIFIYFRKDFYRLFAAFFDFVIGRKSEDFGKERRMILFLIIGTLPAVFVGLLAADFLEENFRDIKMVALMLFLTAGYFFLAEFISKRKSSSSIGFWKAVLIGVAQAFALLPGISRSGSTISTGVILGLTRHEAARFSFLLGSIAITAATLLSVLKVFKGEFMLLDADVMIIGIVAACLAGILSIHYLLKFLKNHSLNIFAVYLLVLASAIFIFA